MSTENEIPDNNRTDIIGNSTENDVKISDFPENEARESVTQTTEGLAPVIEAVLFAAGYPVPYEKLSELLDIPIEDARTAVESLAVEYRTAERGIQIVTLEDSCQMCTREEYENYVRAALGIKQGGKLSNSSLEVLAIVAYRQPVTKVQIEHIRGVDSTYAITSLVAKGLIESKGRLDVPGKPNLYGTTADFLRCFGLSSLAELPDATTFLVDEQIDIDELDKISAEADNNENEASEKSSEQA